VRYTSVLHVGIILVVQRMDCTDVNQLVNIKMLYYGRFGRWRVEKEKVVVTV